MVNELSAMDLNYLIKELAVLSNSKVDRIYHTKEKPQDLIIIMHVTGAGKHILHVMLPSLVFIDFSKQDQGTATGLCMMLRKYLEGSILESISQKGFERIIELRLRIKREGKEERYFIIIELFGKGNIIFCDSEYKILNLLSSQKWKDRIIAREEKYIFPKSIEPKNLTAQEFSGMIKKSTRSSIVKSLAMDFSLGGKYAEELCTVAGIDKNLSTDKVSTKDLNTLYKEFDGMLNKNIKAYSHEGNVYPFALMTLKDVDKKEHESFNDAIVTNIQFVDEKKKSKDAERKRIENIIGQQHKTLSETEKEYLENQSKAEVIYKGYQEIDEMIKTIRDARKKFAWKEIAKKISEDPKHNKKILSVDEKNHSITIHIDE